ncbi:MAG: DUF3108 domain-containing protein [Rikenellaceae bacterium]
MKKGLLISFFLVFATVYFACGEVKKVNNAFKAGERLSYIATYKIGFVNVDVATVTIKTTDDMVGLERAYLVHAVGKINPDYEWFFKMRDEYKVWLNKETLRPMLFKNNILEGDYRYYSTYQYDWKNMKVHTTERKLSWDQDKQRFYNITSESFDALSLFFNLRTQDIASMRVGSVDTLKVVFANRIRSVAFTYMGKEEKRIQGLGKVKTVKFVCQLANDSGVSFKDGSSFTIWLSDDKNLIPLYVDTPIRVGSVRVRLYDMSGLKNPTNVRLRVY